MVQKSHEPNHRLDGAKTWSNNGRSTTYQVPLLKKNRLVHTENLAPPWRFRTWIGKIPSFLFFFLRLYVRVPTGDIGLYVRVIYSGDMFGLYVEVITVICYGYIGLYRVI